jgi:Caspase domain
MFGFIVGIDKYKSPGIPDLHGCKRDAQSMVDLLSHKFHVPSSHFLCLANEKATRSAIISGFQKHLIDNKNIESGDAIVIFYAGHGSRVLAPKGWVADGNKVETICPHDERTIGRDGKEVFSIPDRTLGGLLRKLSSIKGDNIVRIPCRLIIVPS